MADDATASGRQTAPQSPYGFEAVRTGIIVFIIGVLLAYALPALAL